MGAKEGLIEAADQVIDNFNKRKLDLPDGFFDRKAQFLINGEAFETLLSANPNDPLVLMLARGPAGYRFTAKALQHAMPDAKIDRGDLATDGDPFKIVTQLWLSGKLRDTGVAVNSLITVTLRLTEGGQVGTAEADVNPEDLEKIRKARVSG